jgi:hypothetical protein
MLVLASSDEEGNTFNKVEDFSIELIEKGTADEYEINLFNRDDLISEGDYEEHEIDAAFEETLVIWP